MHHENYLLLCYIRITKTYRVQFTKTDIYLHLTDDKNIFLQKFISIHCVELNGTKPRSEAVQLGST